MRSDHDSPIARAWPSLVLVNPSSGPPTMRLEMVCVYSWPITDMSKSPSTHGG